MANKIKTERSPEEVLTIAAEFVANTISPKPTEHIHKQFVRYFKEKTKEMLTEKTYLLLSIGPCVNTDNNGIYSNDIKVILESVEEKMQTKFAFQYGALIWLCQTEIYSVFLPH